jgi:Flp pilus assembly protein CpaB
VRWWITDRRRLARVGATLALALVAGGITATVVGRADAVIDGYGARTATAVATRELAIGDEIGPGDVDWRELPVALVAGTPLADPIGRIVTAPVLTGEPVVIERVAPEGIRGPMALSPPGGRAVAIPVGDGRPPVLVGDHVDVMAVPLDGSTRAQRVAGRGVVVDVGDDAVTVAVRSDELAATARAALEGTAILALTAAG